MSQSDLKGRYASERRRGIVEDERQPMMERLDVRSKRSNFVASLILIKGNHLSAAQMRTAKKALCERKRNSVERTHEEAETQHKFFRRGKNLVCSGVTCVEKEGVQSKVTARKVEVGLKQSGELRRERWGQRSIR